MDKKQKSKCTSIINGYKKRLTLEEADRSVKFNIDKLYSLKKLDPPTYIWVDNPYEANVIMSFLKDSNKDVDLYNRLEKEIDSGKQIYSSTIKKLEKVTEFRENPFIPVSSNASWLAYADILREFLKGKTPVNLLFDRSDDEIMGIWRNIIGKCSYIFPAENVCIVCSNPEMINTNRKGLYNDEEGNAIRFRRNGSDCIIPEDSKSDETNNSRR